MPGDVKSQFENLSGKVSQGAAEVSKSLGGMINSSAKADKAQGHLSKTQASALHISARFEKAISSLSKKMKVLSVSSMKASKGLSTMGKKGERSLHKTKKELVETDDKMVKFTKSLKQVEGIYKKIQNIKMPVLPSHKMIKSVAKPSVKSVKSDEGSKALKESAKNLRKEIENVSTVTDLLKSKFIEGGREAENFAGGLGMTEIKSIAAGVAAFYLFKKMSELIDKFTDARKSIADFNINLSKMGKSTPGVDSSQLEEYRNQLNLTYAQSKDFFDVLSDGARSGVISVGEMVQAQFQLQKAYGGNQTEKLREYVDLLKEIPTLDTDLSITASLDDQASSLFALAKAGKISTVIEMQQAGLAGGIDVNTASPENVDMLNAAQKTEKKIDDINTFLVNKMYPSWGPQFSSIADYTFKSFSAIGGGFALAGALQTMIVKRQGDTVRAVRDVEEAVYRSSGRGGGGGGGKTGFKGIKGYLDTFKKSFKMSYNMRGGKSGGLKAYGGAFKKATLKTFNKEIISVTKNVKSLSVGMKSGSIRMMAGIGSVVKTFAGAASVVGVVLLAAGKAADWFSNRLEKSGDNVGAAGVKLGSEVLTAAGTIASFAGIGAAIGSFVPVIGTAIGAIAGALAGIATVMWNQTDSINNAMSNYGKSLQEPSQVGGVDVQKYGKVVQTFGKMIEHAGINVGDLGNIIKEGTKGTLSNLWTGLKWTTKNLLLYSTGIGQARFAIKSFGEFLQTKEYKAAVKKNTKEIKKSSIAFKKAQEKNKIIQNKLAEEQQRVMKSALSMERQFKATAAAVNNAKTEFSDFRKELGGLQMSIYREIGGSAERFREAADDSATGIKDRFDEVQDGLRKRRAEIIKDGSLDASARKQALMNLNNEELKATQMYVNGMSELIISLMDTPKTLQHGLEMKINEARLDFGETAMPDTEVFDLLGENIKSGANLMKESFENLALIEEKTQQRREAMEKKNSGVTEDSLKAYNSLPDALKEKISSAIKTEKSKDSGGMETTKITGFNFEEGKKVIKDIKSELSALQKDADASSKIIETGSWGELGKKMNQVSEAMKQLNEEQNSVNELIEDAKKDATKREAAEKAQNDINTKRINLMQEQSNMQEKLNSMMTARVGDDEIAGGLLAKMVSAGTIDVKMTKKELLVREKSIAAFNDLNKNGDKVEQEISKRARNLYRQNELEKAQAVVQGGIGDEIELTNIELKERSAIEEELFANANKVRNTIKRISGVVTEETADAKRLLEKRQAETVMAIESGNAIDNINDIASANVKLYEKTKNVNKKAFVELESAKKNAEDMLKSAKTKDEKLIWSTVVKETEESMKNLKESEAVLQKKVVETIRGLDETISQALETPIGRKAGFDIDLSSATMELAQFSDSAMSSLGDMTKLAEEAANKKHEIEKAALDSWVVNATNAAKELANTQKELLMKPVEEGGKGLNEADAQAAADVVYNSEKETINSEKQLKAAKLETEKKQTALKAVEDATKLQMDQLDIAAGMVQNQLDLFEGFGGSAEELSGILNEDLEIEKKRLEFLKKQAAESRRQGNDGIKTKQMELDIVKKETEIKKKEFDNTKRVLDLRQREVDVQDEMLQAQLDFAMDFGSSLSVVTDLQQKQVGLAQQTYEFKKAEYEAAQKGGFTAVELEQKRVAMVIAGLNVQRKSMGVQRDIMEKMLGAALGASRSSIGARRQRGTDVSLMGYENTRMKTRSGMLQSAGEGGPVSHWKRVAQVKGGAGAKRLPVEEAMRKAAEDTAEQTENTAKNTGELNKSANHKGSLYTHDVTTEGLLASILYVAKDIAVGINESSSAVSTDYKSKLEKGIDDLQKNISKQSETTEKQTEKQEETKKANEESLKTEKKILVFDKKNFKSLNDSKSSKKVLDKMSKSGDSLAKIGGGFSTGKGVIPFGRKTGIKTIEDSFGGSLGPKSGIKSMGVGGGAKESRFGDVAMVGFDDTAKEMVKATKESSLSSKDIADVVSNRTLSPVGGGSGISEAKSQFGVGGLVGAGAETQKMTVEGKMTVHFDSAMFKDQVTNVVVTMMKTADMRQQIRGAAFGT